MVRGPMALFGAIIAVGLGPALWLGAQFGQLAVAPVPPPAVTTIDTKADAPGRAGGADDEAAGVNGTGRRPDDASRRGMVPLAGTPSTKESHRRPKDRPTPSPSTSTPAKVDPAPSRSDEPPTAPTESTTPPDDQPTGPTEPTKPTEPQSSLPTTEPGDPEDGTDSLAWTG